MFFQVRLLLAVVCQLRSSRNREISGCWTGSQERLRGPTKKALYCLVENRSSHAARFHPSGAVMVNVDEKAR